ncbi:MAG: CPBP family intramembrane metalloprotease [Verrucomicrobia bacterium]|nr:CPBP family intramembrane metalloprotease [Verrucomicrobiota bacterium]MCH8527967.1 CPBP family intramembrane metalloprotease [Kiritimatiellia bacterium]
MHAAFNTLRAKLPQTAPGTAYLWIECALLYGLLPVLLIHLQLHGGIPFLHILLGMTALTILLALFDPRVQFSQPPPRPPAGPHLRRILLRFLTAALLLSLFTLLLYPGLLFRLPRERTGLWLLILLLYPLLSVLPQHFLFRTFFLQRYRPLFGDGRLMLIVNALLFGWAHAFFLNPLAPLLSLIAGLLFADTWQRTRSLRLTCLEHALYGQLIFTTGLGWFFYNGSAQAIQTLVD